MCVRVCWLQLTFQLHLKILCLWYYDSVLVIEIHSSAKSSILMRSITTHFNCFFFVSPSVLQGNQNVPELNCSRGRTRLRRDYFKGSFCHQTNNSSSHTIKQMSISKHHIPSLSAQLSGQKPITQIYLCSETCEIKLA